MLHYWHYKKVQGVVLRQKCAYGIQVTETNKDVVAWGVELMPETQLSALT